jgi:hypothetical protein
MLTGRKFQPYALQNCEEQACGSFHYSTGKKRNGTAYRRSLKARILPRLVFFGIALEKNRGYLRVSWRPLFLRVKALSEPNSKPGSIRQP